MNKAVQKVVDEAIALDREITEKEEQLKQRKADLLAMAEGVEPHDKLQTDGGGWSVTFEAPTGVARITKPGPKLKASIDAEKPAGAKLMEKIGRLKDELFTPVLKWIPVENIRVRVEELFKPGEARAIIKALTSESAPTVSFETKE